MRFCVFPMDGACQDRLAVPWEATPLSTLRPCLAATLPPLCFSFFFSSFLPFISLVSRHVPVSSPFLYYIT